MSLKTRLLGLASLLIILAASASWLAYRELSEDIIERWGKQVTEIQVRYDSARLLQSLERAKRGGRNRVRIHAAPGEETHPA
ncbi:hypothetical protein [Marinobacter sp. KM021]|uniref:hypothetical protein n=1 Tax=Marinobacter sp. KM021 TaxID=3075616 RepID=UPI003D6C5FCA